MHTITIDELISILLDAHKKGLGSKKILISDDDEGNGYHELFYGLTTKMEQVFPKGEHYSPNLPFGVSEEDAIKNYIILG